MYVVHLSPAAFAVAHEAVQSFEFDPFTNLTLEQVEVFTDVKREAVHAFETAALAGPKGGE